MKCKQIVDPDLEVIDMVNDGVAGRQRMREGRALLARMSKEQKQARKAAWWRDLRSMVIEAGAIAVTGIGVMCAMGRNLVDPGVGIPVFLACMIWTAIRVDRFARR